MNTSNGTIVSPSQYSALDEVAKKQYVEVQRSLTAKEASDMQIRLYAPCACGSGKKFKFCCKTT